LRLEGVQLAPDLTRREFLHSTGAALAGSAATQSAAPRPNLLFILADDLGYGDLSCYGRPDYRTPILDGLARQGLKFTSNYAAAPVCTPTRCAFATGRYPQRVRVGLYEPLTASDLDQGLPPEHPTLASRLRAAGYETGLIGKWHLGWKPEFGPNRHGFDDFYGVLSGAADYFTHRSADVAGRDLWENLAPVERVGYLTDILSDRAAEFVSRRRSRPFYLSLHYTAPHSPWEGPEDEAIGHTDHGNGPMTDGGSLAIYAAMMLSMDAGIGRVLQALRRAGRERDTLVVFTSDNGGERYSFNWPFSFQKLHLWEGGIRVPAIARWPGVVPAGRTTDQPAITMDWTATLMALAGATADPAYPLDGEDLTPLLRDPSRRHSRSLFWRTRTREAARIGDWKYVKDGATEGLFDLAVDPGEKSNLRSRRQPEFERLTAAYAAWNETVLPRLTAP
jgi:arylsulfatase A-like enzyme